MNIERQQQQQQQLRRYSFNIFFNFLKENQNEKKNTCERKQELPLTSTENMMQMFSKNDAKMA